MKKYITLLIVVSFIGCKSQEIKEELKSIKTESNSVRLKISDNFDNYIKLGFNKEKIDTLTTEFTEDELTFKMYTGIDSIELNIPPGNTERFRVEMPEMQPVIVIISNAEYQELKYDTKSINYKIKFWNDNIESTSLKELRAKYPIDSLVASETTDLGKIKKITLWVHNLWEHNGYNVPEKNDALFILDEVAKGKQFRCVEYGIVTTACLNSIGIKARKLSLATKNLETTLSGAGHVLLEAYLSDLNKWIMIDPQFDAIPHIDGKPLNAVELRQAIANKSKIEIWTNDEEVTTDSYIKWISPYLYYMSIKFDNRYTEEYTYEGNTQLMLVPLGAKNPNVFQRVYPLSNIYYTNNLLDFYRSPNNSK